MQPQHRPEQALCLDVGMQVERVLSALCRAFLRLHRAVHKVALHKLWRALGHQQQLGARRRGVATDLQVEIRQEHEQVHIVVEREQARTQHQLAGVGGSRLDRAVEVEAAHCARQQLHLGRAAKAVYHAQLRLARVSALVLHNIAHAQRVVRPRGRKAADVHGPNTVQHVERQRTAEGQVGALRAECQHCVQQLHVYDGRPVPTHHVVDVWGVVWHEHRVRDPHKPRSNHDNE
mmetsp:Transcript_43919/g.131648  ORF Transcript_43919/g.131648 Transcript_43919/m.131648 type:complete len:233 (-) Transcript_43919:1085-1783(-)